MKITTDLTGTESAATRHARIKAIYDWYFGTGAYVAAGNLGVARAALNGLLTSDIANGETFASWLVKMNWLNDLDTAIPALIFAGGYKGIVLDPEVLSSMSQDTAGATPVTAAGQSVGRILDRSGNALHPVQATAAAKPTYQVDGSTRPYLSFDGVDDWMGTTSVTWGTDEVTVIAAVTRLQDAVLADLLGLSTTPGTVGGNFVLASTSDAATTNAGFASSGDTGNALARAASTPINSQIVLTGMGRIGNDTALIRRNGVQIQSVTTDQGAGLYNAAPLYIGARGGASRFFQGRIYGLLAINRLLNPTELALAERWMAAKCGVTL